jgi:ApaG protein
MDALNTKTYSEITHAIRVSATPYFVEEESSHEQNQYLWAYQIRIENLSPHEVQLKRRHWEILDAHGRKQLIEGDGIIGQQPTLKPGDALEYTSSAPLSTPSGVMHGYYVMMNNTGEEIEVTIPAFSLDSPYQARTIN